MHISIAIFSDFTLDSALYWIAVQGNIRLRSAALILLVVTNFQIYYVSFCSHFFSNTAFIKKT